MFKGGIISEVLLLVIVVLFFFKVLFELLVFLFLFVGIGLFFLELMFKIFLIEFWNFFSFEVIFGLFSFLSCCFVFFLFCVNDGGFCFFLRLMV